MNDSISELISSATERLAQVSDSPQLDSQILLAHSLSRSREWLYIHGTDTLADSDIKHFETLLTRRLALEPVAYITGTRHFWNREFAVTPATLIPRPETELLVETVLATFDDTPRHVADLGTGSGAIAISLAEERPRWQVIAIDRSAEALHVAKQNGADLANITWQQSSWCEHLAPQSLDVIVSNPPYVAPDDPHLEALHHEPASALVAEGDGLDCLREIIEQGYACLKPGGTMLLEHGYDQQAAVITLMTRFGYQGVTGLSDLAGVPRAVTGTT